METQDLVTLIIFAFAILAVAVMVFSARRQFEKAGMALFDTLVSICITVSLILKRLKNKPSS